MYYKIKVRCRNPCAFTITRSKFNGTLPHVTCSHIKVWLAIKFFVFLPLPFAFLSLKLKTHLPHCFHSYFSIISVGVFERKNKIKTRHKNDRRVNLIAECSQ